MIGSLGRIGSSLVGILRIRDVRGAVERWRAWNEAHSPAHYRQVPTVNPRRVIESEFLSGFMWFWIMWFFWHDPEAVLGHFPYPDASKWTDEELGIPPDYEE